MGDRLEPPRGPACDIQGRTRRPPGRGARASVSWDPQRGTPRHNLTATHPYPPRENSCAAGANSRIEKPHGKRISARQAKKVRRSARRAIGKPISQFHHNHHRSSNKSLRGMSGRPIPFSCGQKWRGPPAVARFHACWDLRALSREFTSRFIRRSSAPLFLAVKVYHCFHQDQCTGGWRQEIRALLVA